MHLDTTMTVLVQFIQCLISVILKHEYPDIVNWYDELSQNFPEIVKFVPSIGKSVEGRDMPAVHITASSTNVLKIYFHACSAKSMQVSLAVFIQSCFLGWTVYLYRPSSHYIYLFHAGEWISGTTCNYIANFLAENYGKNEEVAPNFSSLM